MGDGDSTCGVGSGDGDSGGDCSGVGVGVDITVSVLVAALDVASPEVSLGGVEVASVGGEEDAVPVAPPETDCIRVVSVGVEVAEGLEVGGGDSDGDCSGVGVSEDEVTVPSLPNKSGIVLHSPAVCTKAPCVIVTQLGCPVTVSYKVMPLGLSRLPTVSESTLIAPLKIALPKSSIAKTGVVEAGGPVSPKLMDIWSGPARMKSNFPPSAILNVMFLSTGSIASTTNVPVNTLGEITSSPAISRSV